MLNDFITPEYIFNNLDLSTFEIIDIRHPFEYNRAHFPNSINTYISTPKEIFKFGKSKSNIFKLIEEITSNLKKIDLTDLARKYILLSNKNGIKEKYLYDYLNKKDLNVIRIMGGYNALLKYVKDINYSHLDIKVLAGYSGSGKSRKISELECAGHQVINLCKLAGHRGSSFGKLSNNQPTQEQFNIDLFLHTSKFDISKPVYIELEPDHLGSISMPSNIKDLYLESEVIWIDKPKCERIAEIVNEYGKIPPDTILTSVKRLEKSFPAEIFEEIKINISNMNYDEAVNELLNYYDSAYDELFKKYNIR